jgi:hypothetical protein
VIADLSASALRLRPPTGPSIPALDVLLDDLEEARSGLKKVTVESGTTKITKITKITKKNSAVE